MALVLNISGIHPVLTPGCYGMLVDHDFNRTDLNIDRGNMNTNRTNIKLNTCHKSGAL